MKKKQVHKLRLDWYGYKVDYGAPVTELRIRMEHIYGHSARLVPIFPEMYVAAHLLMGAYVNKEHLGDFDSAYDAEMAIITHMRRKLRASLKYIDRKVAGGRKRHKKGGG